MKKIILLLFIIMYGGITAQNTPLLPKEFEKHFLTKPHPVIDRNDAFRSPNLNTLIDENFNSGALPTGWTTVDNAGSGNWVFVNSYYGDTLDGTPFAFIDSDAAGQNVTLNAELISPTVDASNVSTLFLSFDHYFDTYSGADVADVDVFDGTSWVTVYTTSADVGGWGNPDHQLIDVTAYKNANFQVRFHYYNANWEYYWAVDNVTLFEPDSDDLMITGNLPGTYTPNNTFTIATNVFNNGLNTQNDFDITINVLDSSNNVVFNETINVTNANLTTSNEQSYYASSGVSLAAGVYTIEATVTLSGDQNNTNDTFSSTLHIIDYPATYSANTLYSYVAFDADGNGDMGHTVSFDMNSGAVSDIGNAGANDFLTAGTFVNNVLVGVEYGTNMIYLIDGTTGSAYKYAPLTGDASLESITGIAQDPTNGDIYFCSPQFLFKLTGGPLNTMANLVGAMNNTGQVMIGIDFDNNGNLYGIDLGDDQLYSIDKTNGSATVVGPLGVDITYAQDIGAHPDTGDLYGTLYLNGGGSGLYSIDKTTGTANLIGSSTADEYTICAIRGNISSISENTIEGLKVFPNPTNGLIQINANENIQQISVTNIAGQEVIKFNNNALTAQLDLSDLPKGHYILKITTDKTVASYRIIKK